MLGISFSEILLILIVALVVFGPEQVPSIAANIGKSLACLRQLSFNLRQQLYQQTGLKQIDNLRQEMQSTLNDIKQHFTPHSPDHSQQLMSNLNEQQMLYQDFYFFYQPELDFEHQPELFDELL